MADKDEVIAKRPIEVPVFKVAQTDADKVYWGLKETPLEEIKAGDAVFCDPKHRDKLPEGAVWVDRDCDQKTGHYRVVMDEKVAFRLDPLERSARKSEQTAPIADRALYEFLWHVQQSGGSVPQYSADWACWYETSVDANLGKLFNKQFAKALGRA